MGPHAPVDVLMATWERHRTAPAPVTDTVERLAGRPPQRQLPVHSLAKPYRHGVPLHRRTRTARALARGA